MTHCITCKKLSLQTMLNFDLQPICNRYLSERCSKEYKHPLSIGICQRCGLIQLIDPVSSEEVKPQFSWIHYNEAEGHLDDLVEKICQLPDITTASSFFGLSDKELSTLNRLKNRGYENVSTLELSHDLNSINKSYAGIETTQAYLTKKTVEKLHQKKKPDVIIARHILEHAHDPLEFVDALQHLVHPEGYIIFEVPDNKKSLELFDYSIWWEEHITYFTPYTFINFICNNGFQVHSFTIYPYDMENSLVIIAKINRERSDYYLSVKAEQILENEVGRARYYAKMYPLTKQIYKDILSDFKNEGKKIAVLGAGHLCAHFINLMDLSTFIDVVIDDDPNKQNLYMPGSQLKIVESDILNENDIDICLLTLNAESEKKVLVNHKNFLKNGGCFYSIFPDSQVALSKYQSELNNYELE